MVCASIVSELYYVGLYFFNENLNRDMFLKTSCQISSMSISTLDGTRNFNKMEYLCILVVFIVDILEIARISYIDDKLALKVL